jgi:hypothetical protein
MPKWQGFASDSGRKQGLERGLEGVCDADSCFIFGRFGVATCEIPQGITVLLLWGQPSHFSAEMLRGLTFFECYCFYSWLRLFDVG